MEGLEMDEMLNERQIWNRTYVSTFTDPTVAVETTESNQTYTFKQPLTTHGNVEDEQNLSPDWNPNLHYKQIGDLTYASTDLLEWELLNPTTIENITASPEIEDNVSTTLVNDFIPYNRTRYQRSMNVPDISTLQSQVGRIQPYSQWANVTRRTSGLADR